MHHTEYSELQERIGSFHNFPNKDINTQKLAEAGFFFIGDDNDSCNCFWCGVCLHQWNAQDDPWEEHKKFNRHKCDFLKYKGMVPANIRHPTPISSGQAILPPIKRYPQPRPSISPVRPNAVYITDSEPNYNRENHYNSMSKSTPGVYNRQWSGNSDKNKHYLSISASQASHPSNIPPHLGTQQNILSPNTTGGLIPPVFVSPTVNHSQLREYPDEIMHNQSVTPKQTQQNILSSNTTGGFIPPVFVSPTVNHSQLSEYPDEIMHNQSVIPKQTQQNILSSNTPGGFITPIFVSPPVNHSQLSEYPDERMHNQSVTPKRTQQNILSPNTPGGLIPPVFTSPPVNQFQPSEYRDKKVYVPSMYSHQ